MAAGAPLTVDEYIAAAPEASRDALLRIRTAIREAVPDAVETISYKIPTYKVHDRVLLHFAGWKEHCAIYPAAAGVSAAFGEELAPYPMSKGTIRFPHSKPLPVALIGRIATFRADEIRKAAR